MFSRSEVDGLFGDTARILQRSRLLLEERSRGSAIINNNNNNNNNSPSVVSSSTSFAVALRGLRGLAGVGAFGAAAGEVAGRLREEAHKGRQNSFKNEEKENKKSKGGRCPLLRRVVGGLVGVQGVWQNNNNNNNSGVEGEEARLWEEEGGAALSVQLILAALFIDWMNDASNAIDKYNKVRQQTSELGELPIIEEIGKNDVLELLSKARNTIPEEIAEEMDIQVIKVISSLSSQIEESLGNSELSALLIFPSLISYIVQCSSSLSVANIINPIERAASGLLPLYLSENSKEFQRKSIQLVQHVTLIGTYAAWYSKIQVPYTLQRVLKFTKRLFDALLVPVEKAFTSALPSPGMTENVYNGFAEPLRRLLHSWLRREKEKSKISLTSSSELLPLWCTASYRGLIIVEGIAQAELGIVSGCGNATAQQKKYNSMLRQSNGKVTTAILSTVTEDRQLLFEETTTRSTQGHKVYRIHEGAATPSVFLYIDNGTVYMKVGRERSFRRAKSVEEVFSIFGNSTMQS